VLSHVVEDVEERVPDFAWRAEESSVKAIAPDAPAAPEHAVHGLGDADGEPLNSACES